MVQALQQKSVTIQRAIFIFLSAIFLMFSFTPFVAYAKESNDPSQVKVEVDEQGGLTIDGGGFTNGGTGQAWKDFIGKYRFFITGIAGIATVTMILIFIFQFLKLGASAGNPTARTQALIGILWSGVAAAALGAVTIIVGFFYNSLG